MPDGLCFFGKNAQYYTYTTNYTEDLGDYLVPSSISEIAEREELSHRPGLVR